MRHSITRDTWGTVYLLHLSARLGNMLNPFAQAQHYIGFALDLDERMEEHRRKEGAKMLAAAVERGITFEVVATWQAPQAFERYLKGQKQAPKLCPICAEARHIRRRIIASDQLVRICGALLDLPSLPTPPTPTVIDPYEAFMLRQWRSTRAALTEHTLPDNWDDGLL